MSMREESPWIETDPSRVSSYISIHLLTPCSQVYELRVSPTLHMDHTSEAKRLGQRTKIGKIRVLKLVARW